MPKSKTPDTSLSNVPDREQDSKGLRNLAGVTAVGMAVAKLLSADPTLPTKEFVEIGDRSGRTPTTLVTDTRKRVGDLPEADATSRCRQMSEKVCRDFTTKGQPTASITPTTTVDIPEREANTESATEGAEDEPSRIIIPGAEEMARFSQPGTGAEAERLFGEQGVYAEALKSPEICQLIEDLGAANPKSMDDLARIGQELMQNAEFQRLANPFNVANPKEGNTEAVQAQVQLAQNLSQFLAPFMMAETGENGLVTPTSKILTAEEINSIIQRPQIMTAGPTWDGVKEYVQDISFVKGISRAFEELGTNMKDIFVIGLSPVGYQLDEVGDWAFKIPLILLGLLGVLYHKINIDGQDKRILREKAGEIGLWSIPIMMILATWFTTVKTWDNAPDWTKITLVSIGFFATIAGGLGYMWNQSISAKNKAAALPRAGVEKVKGTLGNLPSEVIGAISTVLLANGALLTGVNSADLQATQPPEWTEMQLIDFLISIISHIPSATLATLGIVNAEEFYQDLVNWKRKRKQSKMQKRMEFKDNKDAKEYGFSPRELSEMDYKTLVFTINRPDLQRKKRGIREMDEANYTEDDIWKFRDDVATALGWILPGAKRRAQKAQQPNDGQQTPPAVDQDARAQDLFEQANAIPLSDDDADTATPDTTTATETAGPVTADDVLGNLSLTDDEEEDKF